MHALYQYVYVHASVAGSPLQTAGPRLGVHDELRLLGLKRGEHVLDVAASTGAFSLWAARAGADDLATGFTSAVAATVCWDDCRKLRLMTLVKDVIQKVVPEFQLPAAPPAWARLAGGDALRDRHSSPDQGMGLRC